MKKNRSDVYTDGMCNTFKNHEGRTFFFELDFPAGHEIYRTIDVYNNNGLACVVHYTGNGLHFLSPTIIDKEEWKEIIKPLEDLNRSCPMTTLRIQANKHPSEVFYFYKPILVMHESLNRKNSTQMAQKINSLWNTNLNTGIDAEPKMVRYPLPL